jgi:aldose 1-epimerase
MSLISASTTPPSTHPDISVRPFGNTRSGVQVEEYTLTSGNGVSASIITWGGIVRTLAVPDRQGRHADIVLGFDTLEPYEDRHPYFGTITGRFANRIARGKFSVDGKEYTVAINNGPNHLHGGIDGFDRTVWRALSERTADYARVTLSHVSPDGDEGYPGEVTTDVTYTLTKENALRIDYRATTTKATPINLTNHSYFNLAGHASGNVLSQHLTIKADKFVPVDKTLIPTGELASVTGTPFDFTVSHSIGARLSEVGIGYDHTFVLSPQVAGLKVAAQAYDPDSGRALEVQTTEPGVQFYTGNYLDGTQVGKGGVRYDKHGGFCLETQHFPDSVNQPNFPSTILRPGEVYQQATLFKFSTR